MISLHNQAVIIKLYIQFYVQISCFAVFTNFTVFIPQNFNVLSSQLR